MADFVFQPNEFQFPKHFSIPESMHIDDTLANFQEAIAKACTANPRFAAWLQQRPSIQQLEKGLSRANRVKISENLDEEMWGLLQAIIGDVPDATTVKNELMQVAVRSPHGFGYGRLKPLATNVNTLCKLLDVEYRPHMTFTIDDFCKAYDGDTDAVCTVLSRIVNAEVVYAMDFGDPRLDDCYIWHYTDWRCASINYVARGSDQLHYSESGKFFSPVVVGPGTQLLELAGLDLKGNHNTIVTWGEFWLDLRGGQKDPKAYFHATTGRRPTHLFFSNDWGWRQ